MKSIIWTFLVSLVPVIELRGAIPLGVQQGLNIWASFGIALAGNILVGIIIVALLKPVLNWLLTTKWFGNFAKNLTAKFEKHAGKIDSKKKFWGVLTFVAIPLPLTGVWTGAAVAVFLGLSFWSSVLALSVGATIAGVITVLATILLGKHAIWLTVIFAILAVVLIVALLLFMFLKKPTVTATEETKKEKPKNDEPVAITNRPETLDESTTTES